MITLESFYLDEGKVARCIYWGYPHLFTSLGVVVGREVVEELETFLWSYIKFCDVENQEGIYFRVDAFFDDEHLYIIEINAHFVDGWGTALNLSGAAGIETDLTGVSFPFLWVSEESKYRPELELACNELNLKGFSTRVTEVGEVMRGTDEEIYWYGRFKLYEKYPLVRPTAGNFLDDKLHLARFAQTWKGDLIQVPRYYFHQTYPWANLPLDAVLKFRDKGGEECRQAGTSVLFREGRKVPYFRRCYEAGSLVAQQQVEPQRTQSGDATQLVIMTCGHRVVTGYVQFAKPGTKIINDNSIHGPLEFSP